MADRIVQGSTSVFVDASGHTFGSIAEAPAGDRLRPASPYADWRYWNGVINIALLRASEVLRDTSYAACVQRNVSFCFDHYADFERTYDGSSKYTYPFAQRFIMEELDDCGAMGASLIELSKGHPETRYAAYIDRTADFIRTKQARMDDGTLARPYPREWTIWADDLYMSVSFLSRMSAFSGDERYLRDAVRQVLNFHEHLFDRTKGLMVHCWYSAGNRPGVAFWGRANGWAMLAQVDLLDHLPPTDPDRDTLVTLLRNQIMGIARYQGPDGLWHQLLDKSDSFPETSSSAMFTYAIARAVNRGYIEPQYASIARRGWEGVASKVQGDGQLVGVCAGTGVSDDLVTYYHRPTPLNDPHGIGAVLLAAEEMLQLVKE
jgi:unsaturated rhamnogalacturonyl hydrolase